MAHPALERTDHRPWPLPPGRWSWRQSWHDLLFAHWPVPPRELRPRIPPGLVLQERDGAAWIGIVPFRMTGVTRRPLPPLPWISAFPELNVRTYVERDGKPGVWFLSLDAGSRLAVRAARALFRLPYHHARFELSGSDDRIVYGARRSGTDVRFRATYGPTGDAREADPGTLAHWLTERYCLYAPGPGGTLLRTEVHHAPWPLQPASASIEENDLLDAHGLGAPDRPPLLHFSRRQDVVVWSPEAA